ncbi:MAG: tetratricopeptide repeat protein, partial [Methylophilaceae bacterium]|nr:tetratricopeptide repeat protein [Methylophilaceae bacterium]
QVNALNNLANAYDDGNGVEVDHVEAARLWQIAADLGYSSAQNNLGLAYEFGKGVQKNTNKALELFKLSTEQGDPNGTVNYNRLRKSLGQ